MKKHLFFLLLSVLFICFNASSQDAASVVWPLSSSTEQTAAYSGQLENGGIKLQGLAAYNYGGPESTLVLMLAEGGSTNWHTAEDANVYIEFSVTPKEGSILTAKEISAFVCGKGGSNMRANFYYSTDPTFAKRTQIDYRKNTDLTRDSGDGYEEMKVENIDAILKAGEKIYFRIYPYYKSVTTGKYLCLKDVSISGTTEATEVPANVKWAFVENTSPVISGALLAGDMSFGADAKVYGYRDGDATIGGVAVKNGTICTTATSSAWEAGTDIQENIYAQFAVSPKAGATLTVKNISLMISAFSTNNLKAAVYISKDETFANKTEIKTATALVATELQSWNMTLDTPLEIATGETCYLRVYPFNTQAETWKLVALRDVTISGTLFGATADPAEVSTVTSVSYVSTTTAISGGNVSNDGGAAVTERGVVWSTVSNPTVADNKTIDGEGAGSFESTLTGLTAGTTYYVRAYATNKAGVAYGNEVSFTTLSELVVPTVETSSSSNIRNVSFEISGKVAQWGGTEVTERGVVWGTSENPTITTNKKSSGSGLGTYKVFVDNLQPETKYYVRAYAVNSTGTAYGNTLEVTTKATDPDVEKIINQDGTGDYTTVQAAFDAVPANYTGRWIIRIKSGTYNERPTLNAGKVNVYLVGENAETTIITHNTYAGQEKPGGGTWGTSNSQTMAIMADDFTAINITIQNTFVNSKVNAAINKDTQAVALKTQGDRQAFYNCRITGYQDTYLGNSIGRAYLKNCYIEGNVDFIFGRQTVVFDQCTTYVNRNQSVLTAPATEKTSKFGMVFFDCKLTAPATDYVDFDGVTFKEFFYGRPWQNQPKSAFIRCEAPATLNEKGWTTMNGGLNPVFVEYQSTGDGATTERLSKRANEGRVITDAAEGAVYTIQNVLSKDTDPSFAADWMPKSTPDDDLLPITSIDEVNSTSALSQMVCFPNPFTETISVSYNLTDTSDVKIAIYSLNGVLVDELEQINQQAGNYSLSLNTSSFTSGLYLLSLNLSDGKQITQKIQKID
ncbi:T9SS C-terminal target domain-containing protein [Paludibacter sp. 221]|uniref:pectinesterase family protein n=1 Tax=Paludibacter sp. 221 TaxID=2302939 RepID=UPI0013CF6AF0|nr:pectinesterase family protein [Paludibacter sp. 221]NDV46653.1 T9SS C-terminal target domain-containing protein [Paludibacter sp. 221]